MNWKKCVFVVIQLIELAASHHKDDHTCKHHTIDDEDNFLCHRPLTVPDDTLCGTTNTSLLLCYMHRAQYHALHSDVFWINVCMFQSERPQENFVDRYNCRVTNGLGPVNCTSKTNSTDTFIKGCVFTLYPCKKNNISECHRTYAHELEDGGSCAAEDHWCPSDNLFSLTTSLLCDNVTYGVAKVNFTDLTFLDISPPKHCVYPYGKSTVVLHVIGFFGILIGLAIAIWRIKKMMDKSRVDGHDASIQSVEAVLGNPEPARQSLEVPVAEEAPHPFNPILYLERGGSDYSRDTGFDEPAIMSDALLVVSEVEHEESCSEIVASTDITRSGSNLSSRCSISEQRNSSNENNENQDSSAISKKHETSTFGEDISSSLMHQLNHANDVSEADINMDKQLPDVIYSSVKKNSSDLSIHDYLRKSDLDVE